MWKIVLAFIVFAALAIFVLTRSGGNIDLGGEKHGTEGDHAPAAASAAAAGASAAPAPASAASSR